VKSAYRYAVTSDRTGRVEIIEKVDLGTAELIPDPRRPTGWLLMVAGVSQSYVDVGDPRFLEFEYVRRVTSVIDSMKHPHDPIDVLHLGGGAMTLPRYIAAARPGSRQVVVERDEALSKLVLRVLPLPPEADIDIEIDDARAAVEVAPRQAYDLVISDVYEGAQMPHGVTSMEFAQQVARTMRNTGRYVVNVTDLPVLAFTRVLTATLRAVFDDVCVLAEPNMLRGRRFGNVVIAAAKRSGSLPVKRLSKANRVVYGADLVDFIGGAQVTHDGASPGITQPRLS
jgi:spermidine synthase